jgi:hypothetical protein
MIAGTTASLESMRRTMPNGFDTHAPRQAPERAVQIPQCDQPDPKITEQLEAVAKKYNFANYAEFDDVDENIGLVMSGIDPDTKKYVGPDAVIQKEIAAIESEKLAPNDKKGQIEELQSDLKSPVEPVKFPANIDLVLKNYDKLNAALPPVQ